MIFWAVAGALVLAAVIAMIAPLARTRPPARTRGEHGLAVLKDQLAEIDRDRAASRLGEAEAAAARLEVERRILAEADRMDGKPESPQQDNRWRRFAVAAAVIIGLPVATTAVYLQSGTPGLPDLPLSSRAQERTQMAERAQQQQGLVEMTQNLEKRLGEQPDDAEGWMLLGRTRLSLGDFEQAAVAFERAAQVGAGPDAIGEMAEALVRRDRGIVTPDARKAFESVLAASPGDPRSRYYLALAALQAGDTEKALRQWLALAADTPPDAPWRAALMERVEAVAVENGIDLAALQEQVGGSRPAISGPRGPSAADVAAAQAMPAGDRLEMIRGMVGSLQARLEENPDDVEGWRRLGRSWQVLGDPAKSLAAYKEAANRAPNDIDVQLDYARALFPPGTEDRAMPQDFIDVISHIRTVAPEHPEGLFFGGLVAARAGDAATARDLWSRLVERLPPDSPIRAAIEQRLLALGAG